jgi:molecular chaperone GrpE
MNDEQNISPPETQGGQGGVESSKCEKCEEYLAGWKRALADYDNLQKDLTRERISMRESERVIMATVLIEALDSLEKAVREPPAVDDKKVQSWIDGIAHTKSRIEGSLEMKGIRRMERGGVFDPEKHHAVGQRNEPDVTDGTVLETLQDGWLMNEKVIRPAMVLINNKKEIE